MSRNRPTSDRRLVAAIVLLAAGAAMASCTSGPKKNVEAELEAVKPAKADQMTNAELNELTKAAKDIALSNLLLYRALAEALAPEVKDRIAESLEAYIPAPLNKEVEVDYVGPAQEILRSLARQAGYGVEERGSVPPGTDVVRAKGRDKLSSLFRYIGSQVPWLVVVDTEHKMVVFDYQNVTTIERALDEQQKPEKAKGRTEASWATELKKVSHVMETIKTEVAKSNQEVSYYVQLGPYPNLVEAKWAQRRARKNGLTEGKVIAATDNTTL